MNKDLQYILDFIKNAEHLSENEKADLTKSVKNADKELTISEFKLERTEKVKKTTAILLEETIAELEQKRKDVEKHNRELEIEAGLERVRARGMAMQTTEELRALIGILFIELTKLDLALTRCVIWIIDNKTNDTVWWMANYEALSNPMSYLIPYHKKPPYLAFLKEWEKRTIKWVYDLKGQTKKNWDDHLFSKTELSKMPKFIRDGMRAPGRVLLSASFSNFGGMNVATLEPLSDEHFDILLRFAKVFDLTYTRFNDLKKAEAQAREAQIEAALERVRSRSMAMHHTSELQDVINTVHQQLKNLDIAITGGAFIAINEENKNEIACWGAGGTADYVESVHIPFFDRPIYTGLLKCINKGPGFYTEVFSYEEKIEFFNHLFNHPPYTEAPPERKKEIMSRQGGYTRSSVVSKHTSIFIINHHGRKFSEKENNILLRFGKVFEQTYTRFLDLQKAESQAREAQIEASLERVRSRTMGMHKSEELKEVIQLVYEQFVHLNIHIEHTGFIIDYKARDDMHIWLADQHLVPSEVTIPCFDSPPNNSIKEAKEKGQDFFKYLLTFEEKNKFYRDLFKFVPDVPEESLEYYFNCPSLAGSGVLLDNIGLYIENFSGTPYTDEENNILMRFGKVFQQTYTRFLDLQKAEAQARESQIGLALERIRARTMAMQHSDELSETAEVLYQQFRELGENPDQLTIGTVNETEKVLELWLSVQGSRIEEMFKVPVEEPIVINKIYSAWKGGKKFAVVDISGDELKKYNDFRNRLPEYKAYNDAKSFINKEEQRRVMHCAFFTKGLLALATPEPRPEETKKLLERFAGVFDLTYTRFLDLKKAEAQARESEIQLALERVRARTMAMHKSDELAATAKVLFEQFDQLGKIPDRMGIGTINEKNKEVEFWLTDQSGNELTHDFSFSIDEPTSMAKFYEAWKEGKDSLVVDLTGKSLKDWLQYVTKEGRLPVNFDNIKGRRVHHVAFFSRGFLVLTANERITDEMLQLLVRFAGVFDQTYRRFLDLQKAEAQSREAQIEAALERVRSRTMAMQQSDELAETAAVLFNQFKELGENPIQFTIGIINEEKGIIEFQVTNWEGGGSKVGRTFNADVTEPTFMNKVYTAWKLKKKSTVIDLSGQELEEFLKYRNSWSGVNIRSEDTGGRRVSTFAFFSKGLISFSTPLPRPTETIKLLERFASVFDGTYTRFLDLKQAEAQAREAQIEASLEKVRSKTMAMHSSNDVGDTVATMFNEFVKLGIQTNRCGILIFSEDPAAEVWTAKSNPDGKANLIIGKLDLTVHALLYGIHKAWKKNETFYTYTMESNDLRNYYLALNDLEYYPVKFDMNALPSKEFHSDFYFPEGSVFTFTAEPIPGETSRVIKRFAAVFGQTYRRYLDLQKAEAQAREAKIEAALERVRSKTMAMHNSQEVGETVVTLFDELVKLGLDELDRCGIGIMHDQYIMEAWTASKTNDAKAELVIGHIDMRQHSLLQGTYEGCRDKKESFQYILEGDDMINYFNIINDQPNYKAKRDISTLPPKVVLTDFYFNEGCLYVFSSRELSPESAKIFVRFAGVFGQTYRRYLDLLKAETQAREAIKQASLDRIRGEIASMRTAEDLNRITPIIWRELTTLEVPFIRCGVFIIDEDQERTQVYLTTPDGKSLGVLNLSFDANELTSNIVVGWRKKQVYKDHWTREEFINWTKSMMKLGQVQNPETYQGASTPPESLDLHFVPFTQGMLYVGNVSPLDNEKLRLVKTLAEAFSIAYARYEDFRNIEEAKKKVEITLSELKSAQAQLVHSEKMASLGELTAGIAHEIKNPLNFVNNFSEVSSELIQEMKEELEKGNNKDALEIAEDLKQNLEKINHHGKRADSIVKGMLLHSRGTAGEKTPTDINDLLEQYLNLAYHGMRAQNKDFNITIERDYDKTLGKINVVPQDISRVFLNIINNGCYAVNDKKKKEGDDFSPTIKVSTKNSKDKVEIRISDNGNGIPDKIKDKLFQPFFTTKPTGEGTGLGLSLSYDIIVKQHSGEIKIESKEGEGAEFIIHLPA